MTGATDDVQARLRALLVAGDLAGLRDCADSLDSADTKAARAWITDPHALDDHPDPPELAHLDHRAGWEHRRRVHGGRLLLVGRLESPVAAAKGVMRLSRWGPGAEHPEMVAAFVERDRAWAEAFAAAADATRPPAQGGGDTLALLHRHVVLAHGLPVPTGRLFHSTWIRIDPRWHGARALTDAVRVDPLMPDVLLHQLASGEAGRNPALPDTVRDLVDEGWVDRDEVLTVVLEQLTANQRVSGQRVLAGIATRLGLRSHEVNGGLPYLLGVLSTAHGSVAKVLLPLAIDLVRCDRDLADLSRIVAGRPEKGVRQQLLKALAPQHLGQHVDGPALVAALDVLTVGEQDVALLAAVEKARRALGVEPSTTEHVASDALGLWDLTPQHSDPRPDVPAWAAPLRDRCWLVLRAGDATTDKTLVDHLLDAFARDELTAMDLLATAHELAVEKRLSAPRAAALFEPLFLGGAMKSIWPVALEVADLCAAGTRPAAGLDKLLRMLASYAAEPPRPADLPPHLARLARSAHLAEGRSKAAQEAGRLAALLGSATTPGEVRPTRLGLWRESSEPAPWALAYPPTRDLSSLGWRIARTPLQQVDVPGAVRRSVVASLFLDELAALTLENGPDVVRAAVRTDLSSWASPFAQAVGLWATGGLTPESFWAMAQSDLTTTSIRAQWQEELGQHEGLVKAAGWRPVDGVGQDPPLMPAWWTAGGQGSAHQQHMRLEFLHACEVLLVIERGGHLVSTPDVIDGSLGLTHLLERLARAPRVGPLDLRLALGRLRPTDPADAAGIDVRVSTEPCVTSPAGDAEDAADDVRRWVGGGGLRLVPRRSEQPGLWAYDAEAPVSWRSRRALAGTVDDGPAWHHSGDAWSLPGRPDLWLRHGFVLGNRDDSLANVGGTIGVTGWDTILVALGTGAGTYYAPDFAGLVRLQDQGRLDPAVAAAAATARWDAGEPDFIGDALGWERAMLRGALRGLWPVAVAVVAAGASRPHRPPDLDALVSVLVRRSHEVPSAAVPAFLADR